MTVTYWGVRGSVPSPGPRTVRFGGNTACLTIRLGERLLVLDAGTGIRSLGASMPEGVRDVVLVLSHLHADHVQGLPFFEPLYHEDHDIWLVDHPGANGPWTPLELFDGTHFPLLRDRLAHRVRRVERDAVEFVAELGVELQRLPLVHPGGAFGYRVTAHGRSFVHLTDSELGEPGSAFFLRCVDFCSGAEVLSHDAQYRADEMRVWGGRGHSSVEQVCQLARAAGVRRVVLFHHDPDRSDAEVRAMEDAARRELEGAGIDCTAAYEGLEITL